MAFFEHALEVVLYTIRCSSFCGQSRFKQAIRLARTVAVSSCHCSSARIAILRHRCPFSMELRIMKKNAVRLYQFSPR